MSDILNEKLKRNPPTTQVECVQVAVRESLARLGPVGEGSIKAAAYGIAQGLFGEAMDTASYEQAKTWIDMCEREYRKARNSWYGLEVKP